MISPNPKSDQTPTTLVSEEPVLSWDSDEIVDRLVASLLETGEFADEETVRQCVYEDYDFMQTEQNDLREALTELMQKLNPDMSHWHAGVSGFGWRGTSGTKVFCADTGAELLAAILPDTDCTFWIYERDGHLAINNCHHDSPIRGVEWYLVRPMQQIKCAGCNYEVREDEVEDEFKDRFCYDCQQEEEDSK